MKKLTRCLWLLSCLCIVGGSQAYQVTFLPASTVYSFNPATLDANLGFPARNLVVEVFEDQALIPQIKANITGHVASDADSGASAWDGEWPSAPSDGETTFSIQIQGVRGFGIGWSNLQSDLVPEISINSRPAIKVKELGVVGANPDGRSVYMKIEAEPGEADIRNVRLSNISRVRFDHLVLQQSDEKPVRRVTAPLSISDSITPTVTPAVASTGNPAETVSEKALPVPLGQRITAEVTAETLVRPARVELTESSPTPARPAESVPKASEQIQPVSVRKSAELPSAEQWKNGVSLLSKSGRKHVGDQIQFFFVDPEGAIAATKVQWLNLYLTEGKPFRLHGHVWFSGLLDAATVPPDLQDGFAVLVRAWDSSQRYSFTPSGIQIKGRQHQSLVDLNPPKAVPVGMWIPFYLDVNWDRIIYTFGDQFGIVKGPLDMDGDNKIVLAPGTKLKNIRLEVFLGLDSDE